MGIKGKNVIQFDFFGDWRKAGTMTAGLAPTVKRAIRTGQEAGAKKLIKIVKDHLLNQDLNWAPISARAKKNDPRILIDSQAYLTSIKYWQEGYNVMIGVPRGLTEPSGMEIAKVANIHEKGLSKRGIPARPLWGPSIQEMNGKSGMDAIVLRTIENRLMKLGWSVLYSPL